VNNSPLKKATDVFVPITYRIALKDECKMVHGWAFETPGWPEWHACVRWGNRYADELFNDWVIDHYETGLAISAAGHLDSREEAPAKMAALLELKGRDVVHQRLALIL
jgi:hypothetical protein